MKKVLVIALLNVALIAKAQEEPIKSKFGIGFQLEQIQRDFGLGLNITTPYFFNSKMAIRLKGNYLWHDHLDASLEHTWSPYSNASLGMVYKVGEIKNFIRLYGEGGLITVFPSTNFAAPTTKIGGYGLFGFEFYFHKNFNYFIELGGAGTGAVADRVPGKPIYSNGFIINVGFRTQL